MHEPNLAEIVLVEIYFHAKNVLAMDVLEVKAYCVAEFGTVLLRLLFLELIIVFTELLEVKFDATIHRMGFILDLLVTSLHFACFKARRDEFKREEFTKTDPDHRCHGDASQILPVLISHSLLKLILDIELLDDSILVLAVFIEAEHQGVPL